MKRYKKKDYAKRNQILIGIFLIGLMSLSLIGVGLNYSQSSEEQGLVYNGHEFEISSDQRYVSTMIDDKPVRFYNLPNQIEHIILPAQAINDIKTAGIVYVTFDPNDEANLPYYEIIRFDLDQYFVNKGKFAAAGIYESDSTGTYAHFPNIDCNNATVETPVIKLLNSSNNTFTYENNCLIIEGNGQTFVRSRDRLLFGLNGII